MKFEERPGVRVGWGSRAATWSMSCLVAMAVALPQSTYGTITSTSTSWNSLFKLSYWSDTSEWHSDEDYLVPAGKTITTGVNNSSEGDETFQGGPLTVGESSGGAGIVFYRRGSAYFPNGLIIANVSGSTVNFGYSGSESNPDYNTYTHRIYGDVTVLSSAKAAPQMSVTYRSNGQHLYFMDKLIGDSGTGLCFKGNEWSNVNTNNFTFFVGDLTGYEGYLDVQSGGKTHCLALGASPCPGTVKLSGGADAFFRTATSTNDATIANLVMSANSSLYPEIDVLDLTNGTIHVTGSLSLTAPIHVCARFNATARGQSSPAHRFPILSCPASAGTLNVSDFDLVPMDAGDDVGDILSLEVANDSNGTPTLWLVKAAVSVEASEDVVLVTSDASKESAFLEDYQGHWSPAGVPTSGCNYFVKDGKVLRTPYFQPVLTTSAGVPGDDQTFGGDKIVLGDSTSRGEIQHWGYNKVIIPRLVISNGYYTCSGNWSGNRHSWLDAPIEIAATDPAKAVFRTGTTWQHLYLLGAVTGGASAACRMYFTNANSEMYPYGDWSEYYGLLEVTGSGSASVGDVRFGDSATVMPGTLRLGASTADSAGTFELTVSSSGLTVGGLEVNRPTTLYISLDASTLAGSPLTVTNSLALNADVALSIAASGDIITRTDNTAAVFIPVLRVAPAAGAVDATRFSVGALTGAAQTPAEFFELETRTVDGYTVLGLAKRRVVYQVENDDTVTNSTTQARSARTSFDRKWVAADGDNTGRADGWTWSENERPQFAYDYYTAKHLRTHSSDVAAFFQGHALYLKGILTLQSQDVTVTNLYLVGGQVQAIHHGGRSGIYSFLPSTSLTRTFCGNVMVHANSTVVAPSGTYSDALRLACGFYGTAQLTLVKASSSNNGMGYMELSGDNAEFTGILKCSDNSSAPTTDNHLVVMFTETDNLGGERSSFTYNGVHLYRHATLRPLGTATYSRANRGIFVDVAGGVEVAEGDAFTVDAPVTWRGQLVKYGDGALRFAQAPKFLSANGKTVGTEPIANADSNVVRVVSGSVGVTSPTACDGLKLVMEDGGSLNVQLLPASTELAEQGLVNTKASEPFALNGTDGKLHVSLDMTGVTAGEIYTVAVCTLPMATATELRQNIVFDKPSVNNYVAKLLPSEAASGDATDTLFVKVAPAGFIIMIR